MGVIYLICSNAQQGVKQTKGAAKAAPFRYVVGGRGQAASAHAHDHPNESVSDVGIAEGLPALLQNPGIGGNSRQAASMRRPYVNAVDSRIKGVVQMKRLAILSFVVGMLVCADCSSSPAIPTWIP